MGSYIGYTIDLCKWCDPCNPFLVPSITLKLAARRPKSIQFQQRSWRTPKSRTWAWPSLAARS